MGVCLGNLWCSCFLILELFFYEPFFTPKNEHPKARLLGRTPPRLDGLRPTSLDDRHWAKTLSTVLVAVGESWDALVGCLEQKVCCFAALLVFVWCVLLVVWIVLSFWCVSFCWWRISFCLRCLLVCLFSDFFEFLICFFHLRLETPPGVMVPILLTENSGLSGSVSSAGLDSAAGLARDPFWNPAEVRGQSVGHLEGPNKAGSKHAVWRFTRLKLGRFEGACQLCRNLSVAKYWHIIVHAIAMYCCSPSKDCKEETSNPAEQQNTWSSGLRRPPKEFSWSYQRGSRKRVFCGVNHLFGTREAHEVNLNQTTQIWELHHSSWDELNQSLAKARGYHVQWRSVEGQQLQTEYFGDGRSRLWYGSAKRILK